MKKKRRRRRRREGELTVRLLWCGKQWAKTLKGGGGGGKRGDYYGMSVFVRLGGGGVR